jgi:hypothetical protein
MAESNSSNSESGEAIGVGFAVPKVTVRLGTAVDASKVRLRAPTAPATATAAAASARKVTFAAALPPGPKAAAPPPAPKTATLAPAAAEAKEAEGEGVAVAPPLAERGQNLPAASVVEVADESEQAEAQATIAKAQQVARGLRTKRIAAPPPADAPRITEEDFNTGVEGSALKAVLGAPHDAEVKPEDKAYRPITSGEFQDFIIQTYREYSAMTDYVRVGTGGKLERIEKEPDPDACSRRDPNKTEAFYYQKFVRDYLSRDTPYRGLLVYHGLGSGKTCTSVAAAEALYWGGRKTIWVLTPATLSNNYRREIAKCGYFPLRYNNYWQFLESTAEAPQAKWLTEVLGLPEALVAQQGGGWVPDPNRPSNWDTLSDVNKQSIRNQIQIHLEFRFKFIHYNGVSPATLSLMAYRDMEQNTSPFDNAVIVVDEIHNLVRTINGTTIGSKEVSRFIQEVEPPEFNWTMGLSRNQPKELQGTVRYPRGYTFYRLLQNAVNTKIIALSATPMINYAQEFAILMNIVGGEQRTVEINIKDVRAPAALAKLTNWAKQHPEIDYYAIEETLGTKQQVLTLTPVPHGFVKVVDPKNYALRGFVRKMAGEIGPASDSNERNMDRWGARLIQEIEGLGVLPAGTAAAVAGAVTASRPARGPGAPLTSEILATKTYQLLPDQPQAFVNDFIDRETLDIKNPNVLKARATGLISYYKGGSADLMPRSTSEIVMVPMSDYMFAKYVKARKIELEMEAPAEAPEGAEGAKGGKKRGQTAAEADLYAQAIKTQQTGFLALSRAACNFVFPEGVERPMNAKQKAKLLGLDKKEGVIAADLHEDYDAELDAPKASAAAAAMAGEEAEAAAAVALEDEPEEVAATATEAPAELREIIGEMMTAIDVSAAKFMNADLIQYSPKYAEILGRIRASPGPALVYSQFKTLEGLGLFAAALRAAPEGYLPLDIVKNAATQQWEIPEILMDPARPRYILYTGDQDLEKRRLLLQLYNADVAGLPPKLAEQCALLLAGKARASSEATSSEEGSSSSSSEATSSSSTQAGGATSESEEAHPDNRHGRICKVFMITQSGAEGISLFNTRQVHIMEPYWNNVRLEQVIGRAIRLCSHMNLPWEDRVVNVFTYLSVFSDHQKADASMGRSVMLADKGKTTDEQIYGIALIKKDLADSLFEIAQASAADCQIHYYEQGQTAGVVCFEYKKGSRPNFLYHPDVRRDLLAAAARAGPAASTGGAGGGR